MPVARVRNDRVGHVDTLRICGRLTPGPPPAVRFGVGQLRYRTRVIDRRILITASKEKTERNGSLDLCAMTVSVHDELHLEMVSKSIWSRSEIKYGHFSNC